MAGGFAGAGPDRVAARGVDHKQPVIDELERESRGEVVAAGFDEHHVELGK